MVEKLLFLFVYFLLGAVLLVLTVASVYFFLKVLDWLTGPHPTNTEANQTSSLTTRGGFTEAEHVCILEQLFPKEKFSRVPSSYFDENSCPFEATSANPDSCSICMEIFSEGDAIIRTPCTHIFHHHCILQWFLKNDLCPYCRKEVVSSQQFEQAVDNWMAAMRARSTEEGAVP